MGEEKTLRQRKSTVKAPDSAKKPKADTKSVTIDTSKGHLGVTLQNGDLGGVKITELDEADLIFKAGLKVDDVIKSVNGTVVDTHEACLKAFDDCDDSNEHDDFDDYE